MVPTPPQMHVEWMTLISITRTNRLILNDWLCGPRSVRSFVPRGMIDGADLAAANEAAGILNFDADRGC